MTRVLGWLLLAFAVYYLLTQPDGAAGFVHHVLDDLRSLGNSLSQFVSHL